MSNWRTADLTGRRVIITGATSGLGLEITRVLHARGADVVMACRSTLKGEDIASSLRQGAGAASLSVEHLDLAQLDSVRDFARRMSSDERGFDLLINNAGVMAVDEGRTADGLEMTMGVNYVAPALLSLLLLGVLEHAGQPRITTMSSIVHWTGRVDLDDLFFQRRRYRRGAAYAQSKLANLLFAIELDRRLRVANSAITSLAAHPGATATHLGHDGTSLTNLVMRRLAPPFLQGVRRGAEPMLRAALDEDLPGGTYVGARYLLAGPPRLERPARRARDAQLARALFEHTCELVGVDGPTGL